jgi:hypothetical protein
MSEKESVSCFMLPPSFFSADPRAGPPNPRPAAPSNFLSDITDALARIRPIFLDVRDFLAREKQTSGRSV